MCKRTWMGKVALRLRSGRSSTHRALFVDPGRSGESVTVTDVKGGGDVDLAIR